MLPIVCVDCKRWFGEVANLAQSDVHPCVRMQRRVLVHFCLRNLVWVGLCWAGLGWVGLGLVRLGWIGLGWVGLG